MRAQNEDEMSISALLLRFRKSIGANRFIRDDAGASAIEYGLIMAAIGIAIIAAVFSVGDDLSSLFNTIASNISSSNAN